MAFFAIGGEDITGLDEVIAAGDAGMGLAIAFDGEDDDAAIPRS
jgi:hypothetical protein